MSSLPTSRRSVLNGAAWSAPVVVLATTAPSFAAASVRDLALTVATGATSFSTSGSTSVTFTVTNNGTQATTSGSTVVSVPKVTGLTLAPGSMPSGWTVVDNGTSYTITGPDLGVGASIALPFTATSNAPGNYTVSGSVTPITGETTTTNNTASAPLAVNGVVDLQAEIGASATTIQKGAPINLIYTVRNVGTLITTGQITVNLNKPNAAGTYTVAQAPASGWTVTDMGTYFQYKSLTNTAISPGTSVIFSYTFIKTDDRTGTTSIRTQALTIGDAVSTNNAMPMTLTYI
ncbi:MAG: hypothetical protein V9G04_13015 [Nocardioides sp.]|jgi:hypothetical protein